MIKLLLLLLFFFTAVLPLSKLTCGENIAICDGLCCSKNGYCGSGLSFCGVGCQEGYGKCFNLDNLNNAEEVTAELIFDEDSASDNEKDEIQAIPLVIEEPDEIPALSLTMEKEIPSPPEDFNVKKENVTYGEINRIKYYSSMTGTERPAIVITPPNYDTNKKYPVLYLNHGGEGDENDYLKLNINEIYGNLLARGETEPMIIVLVNDRVTPSYDFSDPSYSLSKEHMKAWADFLYEFTDILKPYIESHYSVLTGRKHTAMAGFSMGGRESLYISIKHPELIGYIAAFSPASGIFKYENFFTKEDGLFTEEQFSLANEYVNDTYLLIMSGRDDEFILSDPLRYHKVLVANGFEGNNYYYDIPGGHESSVWNHGIYNFLKIVFK